LELSNLRAFLEVNLRTYPCLTVGDVLNLPDTNGKCFEFKVVEVRSRHVELRPLQVEVAVLITDTDFEVDFVEPMIVEMKDRHLQTNDTSTTEFVAFSGPPRTICGKPSGVSGSSSVALQSPFQQQFKEIIRDKYKSKKVSNVSLFPGPAYKLK
jgi:hypothetical protein